MNSFFINSILGGTLWAFVVYLASETVLKTLAPKWKVLLWLLPSFNF